MKSFYQKIYWLKFFDDLVFIYPFYSLMMLDAGLTTFQLSQLLIIWSVTSFLLEVPSGVLADKYSRKNLLLLGQLIRVSGYAFWVFMPDFYGFLIGFVLWGVKSALWSGTFEALIYDALKAQNKEQLYAKVIGRSKAASSLGILFASLGAALAIHQGYAFVIFISLISLLISAGLVASLRQSRMQKSTEEVEYFSLLKKGVGYSLKHKQVLLLMIFIAIFIGLPGALEEYSPIFVDEVGFQGASLALFFVLVNLVEGITSFYAHRVKIKRSSGLVFFGAFMGSTLFITSIFYSIPFLVFFLIHVCFLKLFEVHSDVQLHNLIPSQIRATVASVNGFFMEVVALLGYLLVGIVSTTVSMQRAFLVFSAVLIFASLILFFALPSGRSKLT